MHQNHPITQCQTASLHISESGGTQDFACNCKNEPKCVGVARALRPALERCASLDYKSLEQARACMVESEPARGPASAPTATASVALRPYQMISSRFDVA
jgi:hypothetical protein